MQQLSIVMSYFIAYFPLLAGWGTVLVVLISGIPLFQQLRDRRQARPKPIAWWLFHIILVTAALCASYIALERDGHQWIFGVTFPGLMSLLAIAAGWPPRSDGGRHGRPPDIRPPPAPPRPASPSYEQRPLFHPQSNRRSRKGRPPRKKRRPKGSRSSPTPSTPPHHDDELPFRLPHF